MKYSKMRKYDTSNWEGVNATIFFSGCTLKCPGCFNEEAQSFNHGFEFTEKEQDLFIKWSKDEHVTGVCILGGEPFQQNFDEMWKFLLRLTFEVEKPIHVWTGYTYEEILKMKPHRKLLNMVDTLVDGRFEIDKKDMKLLYRGSSNQRVIDVHKSILCGKVHLVQGVE